MNPGTVIHVCLCLIEQRHLQSSHGFVQPLPRRRAGTVGNQSPPDRCGFVRRVTSADRPQEFQQAAFDCGVNVLICGYGMEAPCGDIRPELSDGGDHLFMFRTGQQPGGRQHRRVRSRLVQVIGRGRQSKWMLRLSASISGDGPDSKAPTPQSGRLLAGGHEPDPGCFCARVAASLLHAHSSMKPFASDWSNVSPVSWWRGGSRTDDFSERRPVTVARPP